MPTYRLLLWWATSGLRTYTCLSSSAPLAHAARCAPHCLLFPIVLRTIHHTHILRWPSLAALLHTATAPYRRTPFALPSWMPLLHTLPHHTLHAPFRTAYRTFSTAPRAGGCALAITCRLPTPSQPALQTVACLPAAHPYITPTFVERSSIFMTVQMAVQYERFVNHLLHAKTFYTVRRWWRWRVAIGGEPV